VWVYESGWVVKNIRDLPRVHQEVTMEVRNWQCIHTPGRKYNDSLLRPQVLTVASGGSMVLRDHCLYLSVPIHRCLYLSVRNMVLREYLVNTVHARYHSVHRPHTGRETAHCNRHFAILAGCSIIVCYLYFYNQTLY